MENNILSGTWTKNPYGQWCVKIISETEPLSGQKVSVSKKSGERQDRYVTRVDFANSGSYLCAVSEIPPEPPLPDGWRKRTFSVGYVKVGEIRYYEKKEFRENWFFCEKITQHKELNDDNDRWETVDLATLRPITDKEWEEVQSRSAALERAKIARGKLLDLFLETGEKLSIDHVPETAKQVYGGKNYDDQKVYDCGEYLLLFTYNNRDGDDWSLNNCAGGVLKRLYAQLVAARELLSEMAP